METARKEAFEILGSEKLRMLESAGLVVVYNEKKDIQQIAFFDLEPALEVVQKVEEELKDYHWTLREIERLRSYLEEAGEGMCRQYGIDSAMPKPKGGNTDPVHREVQRRARQWQRLEKLEQKVKRIESAVEKIQDEKQRTVLECIMDGERMNIIAKHVGVSRQRLNEIKRELIKRLAWEMYGEELKGT